MTFQAKLAAVSVAPHLSHLATQQHVSALAKTAHSLKVLDLACASRDSSQRMTNRTSTRQKIAKPSSRLFAHLIRTLTNLEIASIKLLSKIFARSSAQQESM
jgi:hypothetical protein